MTPGSARAVVQRFYELANSGRIDEAVELIDVARVEAVTRDGRISGKAAVDDFRAWVAGQQAQFDMTMQPERYLDPGDGTVVVLLTVRRRSRDPAVGDFTAWPAHVMRVEEGRIVFFEGYQNRDEALRDTGLDED